MTIARRNRRLAAGALGLLLASVAGPAASAADTATTTTSFTLAGGTLSISAPPTAELEQVLIGATEVQAILGAVTVTDSRGGLDGAWTATVSSTDFTTAAAASNNSIPKGSVSYMSGVVVPSGGVGTVAGTGLGGLVPVILSEPRTAASANGIIGAVSATWTPTVKVAIPGNVVAGEYTGTITHSVA